MKKDSIINTLTKENFSFAAGEGTYVFKSESGDTTIEMTCKTSHVMPGDYTGYDCTIDGKSYNRKPIGFYKKMFGAVVNHRDTTVVKTAKVMTDSEISEKVASFKDNVQNLLTKVATVLSLCGYDNTSVLSDLFKAVPATYVEDFRSVLLSNREKAVAEKAAAEKAAAEKAEKAERRELAKVVNTFDSVQAALLKAIADKDFAKVAELTAQMQSA